MARKDISTLRDEAARAVEKGKLRPALELYDELERRQPDEPSWPKRAGEVHRRLGDKPDAIVAFERAIDRYIRAGFLVQAIAVCKTILAIDGGHSATLKRLAELAAPKGPPPGVPMRKKPSASPPPDSDDPARIFSAPPRRTAPYQPVTLPAGAPLDAVALGDVVPGAQRLKNADGSNSGIVLIPLEQAEEELELELLPDDPADAHTAIDAAIHAAEPELDLDAVVPRPSLDLEARRALMTTPLLAGLPPRVLESLVTRLSLVELEPGAVLFREGDPGTCLYVVSEGEVVVETAAAGELARLGPGEFFGEISLVTDLPRSATIRAPAPVELLAIDRDVIRELVADHPEVLGVVLRFVRERLIGKVMRTSELFRPFSEPERAALSARFELVEVEPGSPLIVQGQRADGLYVILAGRVEVWRDREERPIATLGPADVFGEISLLGGAGSVAHVRAATRVLGLRMPAATFRVVIMTHPQVLAYVGELAERRAPRPASEGDFADLHLDVL